MIGYDDGINDKEILAKLKTNADEFVKSITTCKITPKYNINYLKDKLTYLAGPIAMISDNDAIKWRDNITPILQNKYSIIVQDPCKKTITDAGELGDDKLHFKKLIKDKKYEQVKHEFYKIIRADLKAVKK